MTDTTLDRMNRSRDSIPASTLLLTFLAVTAWINASEVVRYLFFVMPMTRADLAMVPGIAPWNVPVFLSWGVWDTVLTVMAMVMYWLCAERFGPTTRTILLSGTLSWFFFFFLFWLGLYNMNLARPATIAIALPWAWVEMVVAGWVMRWALQRFS